MSARAALIAAAMLSAGWVHAAPVAPAAAKDGKPRRSLGTGVLNLNTASLDQIDALPGVSPKLAAAVVAERAARPFTRPEDLMRVRGMGKRRFERLRPHLAVTGPSTFVPASGRASAGGARASAPPRPSHP